MPQKRTAHEQPTAATAIVLFGIGDDGKPRAARFTNGHAALAAKAAKQLHLQIARVTDPNLATLAARLPAGRIHGSGRSIVPYVTSALYAKLIEATGSSAAEGAGASSGATPNSGNLPGSWDEIAPGHVVVAQESPIDGWYDALVLSRSNDMLTLRWRDYPEDKKKFSRHRLSVALMHPIGPAGAGQVNPGPAKPRATSKAAATEPSANADHGLPETWDAIDCDHLVLAKGSDPWAGWWEAIPIEKKDHVFTVRWRDYPQLPTIVRHRYSLALLYPNR